MSFAPNYVGDKVRARPGTFLSKDQLRNIVPAAFATEKHESRSDRYAFIPTEQTIDVLLDNGFKPVEAGQIRTRTEGKEAFTKHMVRFQHPDAQPLAELGGLTPEVVMFNGHDGTSAYKLLAGLFRILCENGMISGSIDSMISIMHSGKVSKEVLDAAFTIVSDAPKLLDVAKDWSGVKFSRDDSVAFATAASALRWGFDHETLNLKGEIDPAKLLTTRRWADQGEGAWNVFNVVQENLIKGGQRVGRNPLNGRRISTRTVKGIGEDLRINRRLWTLATESVKIVKDGGTLTKIGLLALPSVFPPKAANDVDDAVFEDVAA